MAVKKKKNNNYSQGRGMDIDRSSDNKIEASNLRKTYRNPCSLMLFMALLGIILLAILRFHVLETESSAIEAGALEDFDVNARFHTYEVLNEFRHDPMAFTQGLEYGENDTLYESTGLYGQSSVREVHLQTGKVQRSRRMKDTDFGEGLTQLHGRLYQVSWQTNVGYIYDQLNFSKVKSFRHPMKDGWGLANDGKNLFGSDGSSKLYYFDSVTFKEKHRVTVKYEGIEVFDVNELEYINGEVWANVWQTDCIARISPEDGTVLGWILFHKLRQSLISSGFKNINVLNGIAWDKRKNRLFVTGKLWPKLYQIKLRSLSRKKVENLASIRQLCQLRESPTW